MHVSRAAIGAVICSLVLLAGSLGATGRALAAGPCRADPIVSLSNGLQIDLYTTLNDAGGLQDVTSISYVLHGPPLTPTLLRGLGAVSSGSGWYSILYPDGTGPISSFKYVADDPSGAYDVYITVVTKTSSITMTASIGFALLGGATSVGAAVQGMAGQPVHLVLAGLSSLNLNAPLGL
jgi:hypothetical protein